MGGGVVWWHLSPTVRLKGARGGAWWVVGLVFAVAEGQRLAKLQVAALGGFDCKTAVEDLLSAAEECHHEVGVLANLCVLDTGEHLNLSLLQMAHRGVVIGDSELNDSQGFNVSNSKGVVLEAYSGYNVGVLFPRFLVDRSIVLIGLEVQGDGLGAVLAPSSHDGQPFG